MFSAGQAVFPDTAAQPIESASVNGNMSTPTGNIFLDNPNNSAPLFSTINSFGEFGNSVPKNTGSFGQANPSNMFQGFNGGGGAFNAQGQKDNDVFCIQGNTSQSDHFQAFASQNKESIGNPFPKVNNAFHPTNSAGLPSDKLSFPVTRSFSNTFPSNHGLSTLNDGFQNSTDLFAAKSKPFACTTGANLFANDFTTNGHHQPNDPPCNGSRSAGSNGTPVFPAFSTPPFPTNSGFETSELAWTGTPPTFSGANPFKSESLLNFYVDLHGFKFTITIDITIF